MTEKTKAQYLDANPAELGDELQALVSTQRVTYDADKVAKQAICAHLNAHLELPEGKAVVGVTFTRWGQFQIIVADKPASKESSAKARPTLAAFLAAKQANGERA